MSNFTGKVITKRDEHLLKFLTDIKCTKMANSDSFTLEFEFSDNRIMENRTLRKHYYMSSESMMERAEGTTIRWIKNDFTKRAN